MGWVDLVMPYETIEDLTDGDDSWDILGEACDKIDEVYERVVGRKPYLEEVLESLNFVAHSRYQSARKEEDCENS